MRLFVLVLAVAAAPAGADIYRWTDADGVVHYTNHPETMPKDARGDTPFVRERPRAPAPPEASEPAGEEPPGGRPAAEGAPPGTEALEVESDEQVAGAYAAGFEAGALERPPPVVEVHAAPVVQQVVVEAADPDPRWVAAPLFPAHPVLLRERRRPAPPLERQGPRTPFLVGPAGPPPVGAPGPAPITLD